MVELFAVDPAIERRIRVWQTERVQKGEDPFDLVAFRKLECWVGSPDPGDAPPHEFFWFTVPPEVGTEVLAIGFGNPPRPKKAPSPAEWLV